MKLLRYRYIPMTAYLGYAGFVIACLLFGPVKFQGIGYGLLLGFLGIYLALFFVGYVIGSKGEFNLEVDAREALAVAGYRKIRKLYGVLLVGSVCYSAYAWIALIASGASLSLASMGENYMEAYSGYERGSASIDAGYIFLILIQTIVTLTLVLGFANYRVLERRRRWFLIFVVISYVMVNMLAAGKQKYLGDIILYTVAAGGITLAAKGKKIPAKRILQGLGLILVAGLAFVEIQHQRYSVSGTSIDNIASKQHPLIIWDVNTPLVDLLGVDYGFALGAVLLYFSNGLYGLYLSLTLPFEWSYFVGNSYSLGRIVEIALGQDGAVLHHTYPYRVDMAYGWGFDKWHSAFAWIASDIGFTGVLLLTPFFARFYAKIWREAVNATNVGAAPLFIYLSMGLAFSFSNNQLVHTLSGVFVLIFLIGLWARNRKWSRRISIPRVQHSGG